VRRLRVVTTIVAALALAPLVGACGGDDDENRDPTPTPPVSETPSGGSTPPSAGQLPPEFIACMAEHGVRDAVT
jgi:hypothetical protein